MRVCKSTRVTRIRYALTRCCCSAAVESSSRSEIIRSNSNNNSNESSSNSSSDSTGRLAERYCYIVLYQLNVSYRYSYSLNIISIMKKHKGRSKKSNASMVVKQPLQDKAIDFIKGGNIEALAKMTEEGSDEIKFLNKFHSKTGKTSICVACEEGQVEAVELLLEAKAAVDLIDKTGMTPVLYAAKEGDNAILERLQRAQADFNIRTSQLNETPLILATKANHLKTVQLLNEYGADIDAVNVKEETALAIAIKMEFFPIAEYLQQRGGHIDFLGINGNTPLLRSAFDGREATTRYLLEHGADVHMKNVNGETALIVAARHGHIPIMKILLQHGANINDEDQSLRTSLMVCCMTGRFDSIQLLLEGIIIKKINTENETAAVERKDDTEESLDVIVAADPNLRDAWGYSALMHLCTSRIAATQPNDLIPSLDLLLEKGAYIDQMDKNYNTSLMHCCGRGLIAMAELLVDRGAVHTFTNIHHVATIDMIRDETERERFESILQSVPTLSERESYSRPGTIRKPDWVNVLNHVD